jgi:hypothetical protein
VEEISDPSGDLFRTIGHHGPAVENEWLALRIYFDFKTAIDVYSKVTPGLESLETWITATSAKDQDINTMEKLIASLESMFSNHN